MEWKITPPKVVEPKKEEEVMSIKYVTAELEEQKIKRKQSIQCGAVHRHHQTQQQLLRLRKE